MAKRIISKRKPKAQATPTAVLDVEDYTPDVEGCEQGRWITHEETGAEFLIASTSQNPAWDAAMFESARRMRERAEAAGVDIEGRSKEADKIRREETAAAISMSLLLKWRNVNKGGKPLAATQANRTWFALHVRWVADWVVQQANERGNFRAAALERDSGN